MSLENIKIETTVSQEWAERLNHLSLETGSSLEELVQEAIGQYLEKIKVSYNSDSVDLQYLNLQKELLNLQKKVQSLEPLLHQVAKLEVKILGIEKIVIPELSISPISTFAQLLINDNDQDEPDEILTDFLVDS
jgi:predicted DNA-binding protein